MQCLILSIFHFLSTVDVVPLLQQRYGQMKSLRKIPYAAGFGVGEW
jgi:hypothetical protein